MEFRSPVIQYRNKDIIAVPPGATIMEIMYTKNITPLRFAMDMKLSTSEINSLMEGAIKISLEIAERLHKVLGGSKEFWLKLDSIYWDKVNIINRKIEKGDLK